MFHTIAGPIWEALFAGWLLGCGVVIVIVLANAIRSAGRRRRAE